MAEFPALTLWTDAYLSDTRHLSTLDHGAYLLLLMEAWRRPNCDLPDDDRILSRMTGLSGEQWAETKPIVMAFWKLDRRSKVWRQKRLSSERDYARTRSKSQADKAAKRWHKTENEDAAAKPRQSRGNAPTATATATIEEEAKASPSPRASKPDPFPKPDGVEDQVWRDFLANRKRKSLPNTATAHKRLIDDLARFSDDDWPPGRLIEHAAAKGWAGIYDPRETQNGRSQHSQPPRESTFDTGRRIADELFAASQAR